MSEHRPPRLVLMDGHSLAYRAFYALPPMHTRRGEPTNAVLGFTNMLLKTIEVEKPEYFVVSFDRGLPTERLEQFAEYKAGRDKMAETMHSQMPLIEEVVRAFGIPIVTSPGNEADDCIGTLARRAEREGWEVVIVSGDLDMLQLVSPSVRVMATIRGVAETVRYDEKAVLDRFGFPPARIPDFKALAGDTSDNIPGVLGIGKGTASKLIQDFGDIDGLLERMDEVPPRWRDKIMAQAEDVRTFKKLATIQTDLALELEWASCAWNGVPREASEVLLRLEFFQLVQRLGLEESTRAPKPAREYAPVEVRTVEDEAGLGRAMDVLRSSPLVGLAWVRDRERTVAFAAAPDESSAFVFPVGGAREGELFAAQGLDAAHVAAALKPFLGAGQTAWTFGWKDAMVEWGLDEIPRERAVRDVGVASYLLESGESQKSLLAIAARHERRPPPDPEKVLGRGAGAASWADRTRQDLASFAAETAASARDVGEHLGARLSEEGLESLFTELEMPLSWVLARMQREGIVLDVPYLRELAVEMDRDLAAIQADILALAGREFNIGSPKQLGEVLFDHLGIPGGKRTKTGAYVTDADVLTKLAAEYPICRRIMEYREIAKLKGTYVEALPRLVDPASGRLHTSWNATVAATGRLSSSDPNLQNIPIRSELGRRIRRAFVAAPGHLLLCLDYSQIELRIMAHLSQDESLVSVFREGGDVHHATAAEVFGVPREQVTADMRRKAKEVNFGIMYGMGPEGLASRINVSRKEAREFIDRYLERFGGVREVMKGAIRQAEETGYVETMLGRRRYLPDIRSQNRMIKAAAERMAVNAPIQGTAADLIKKAMVDIDALRLPARMILQVHDELVFEVEEGVVVEVAGRIRAVMEEALPMSVPIQVDVKAGRSWAVVEPLVLAGATAAG